MGLAAIPGRPPDPGRPPGRSGREAPGRPISPGRVVARSGRPPAPGRRLPGRVARSPLPGRSGLSRPKKSSIPPGVGRPAPPPPGRLGRLTPGRPAISGLDVPGRLFPGPVAPGRPVTPGRFVAGRLLPGRARSGRARSGRGRAAPGLCGPVGKLTLGLAAGRFATDEPPPGRAGRLGRVVGRAPPGSRPPPVGRLGLMPPLGRGAGRVGAGRGAGRLRLGRGACRGALMFGRAPPPPPPIRPRPPPPPPPRMPTAQATSAEPKLRATIRTPSRKTFIGFLRQPRKPLDPQRHAPPSRGRWPERACHRWSNQLLQPEKRRRPDG
ncbi:hypothetical protein Pla111_31630 [Botrimarina hoheduenensis]|uniref:Uncharacterized protein n=1 Tax=Botrimarina hoheduenensis TaxID=2528000 RepID=A0A5C5VS36_9BACT|nr:hypothetical protein Pla111_31630 [Botrimarina hoheduenensis]